MLKQLAMVCAAVLLSGAIVDDARAQARSEADTQRALTRTNYARGGYFLAASGVFALENSSVVGGKGRMIGSGGFDLRLGHRHNRWFATDFFGIYVNRFRASDGSFLAWGLGVNERFFLTKTRFQPFLQVGMGFLQVRGRDDDEIRVRPGQIDTSPGFTPGFSARFGVGAETYTTEDFAIIFHLTYHLTAGHISDHDFVTAGVGLQFF